jgi:hypothetical protein
MPQTVHLALVPPTNEKFTVRRKPNAEYRSREHLTEREVEAAKGNRQGHRGLCGRLVDLRWEQADLENALLHVRGDASIDRTGATGSSAAAARARA